ncbi:MAG TPA: hypothetical protein VI916_07805 [Acidimicrobiia bacterium]|nr:hypothetical protein [Acidimicrobiia bacterium]
MGEIIRQVDHVIISAGSPEPVFELLTGTLGLPASWPIGGNDDLSSGGVYAGNCNIESAAFAADNPIAHPAGTPPTIAGLAFEPPPLSDALAEMDRRGVAHLELPPAESGHEHAEFGWTNSAFLDVTSLPEPFFFACEYGHDVPAWRARLRAEFDAVGGGPFGIDGVRDVTIGAPDVERSRSAWQKLMDPCRPSDDGAWRPGGGSGVRVVAHNAHAILSLRFAVRDLDAAVDHARRTGVLAAAHDGEAKLDPSAMLGLDLRLVSA